MSSIRDEFRARCEFYGSKCRQKLYRTQLSHNLALYHVSEIGDLRADAQFAPLFNEALEAHDMEPPRQHEKLVKIIAESHFLTLKANFEYFLNRMLYCLWSSRFEQLAHRSTAKLPLREVAQALSDKGERERLIGRLIPAHGLDRFKDSFSEATNKSLPVELNTPPPGLWNQIHTAFEVRHLVEHCNGRINQAFVDNVQWKQSSWCDFAVGDQATIEVRRKDFEATCESMLRAARTITHLTSNFWIE